MDAIPADAALRQLRQAIYQDLLGRRKDTLFELLDAVSSAPGPLPLAHHSLSPLCQHGWASLPKALAHGTLDPAAARQLLVASLPRLPPGQRPVWIIDGTTWPRPDAVTSPERTWSHRANRGIPQHGLIPGWEYQWLGETPDPNGSWLLPLDLTRRGPAIERPTPLALTQLRAALAARPAEAPWPIAALDSGYGLEELLLGVRPTCPDRLPVSVLVRLNRRRRVESPPLLYSGRGRRPTYGPPLYLNDPATQPPADREQTLADPRRGTVTISVWTGMRVRGAAGAHPFCLVRITMERLPRSERAPEPLWLAWLEAEPPADLALLWAVYRQRFTIEHAIRFTKQELGWTTVRLRDPGAADRWSWLVALAWWQLWLGRELITEARLPWQPALAPARLTPGRVRRALGTILAGLGQPTRPVRRRGKSPGRRSGQCPGPKPRHAVVRRRSRAPPRRRQRRSRH
jgi:hypothetical protein